MILRFLHQKTEHTQIPVFLCAMCYLFFIPSPALVRPSPYICEKEVEGDPLPLCITQQCCGRAGAVWGILKVRSAVCRANILILKNARIG